MGADNTPVCHGGVWISFCAACNTCVLLQLHVVGVPRAGDGVKY